VAATFVESDHNATERATMRLEDHLVTVPQHGTEHSTSAFVAWCMLT
jgi:hypothetical protein